MATNPSIVQEDLMSFSPADISVYMAGYRVGTLLSVTYSITREVIGLFALGDPNAVGFNKGKRGIAGSLVFNQFQNHPLLYSNWAAQTGLYNPATTSPQTLGTLNTNITATVSEVSTSPNSDIFGNGSVQLNTNPSFTGGQFNMLDPTLRSELSSSYNWVAQRVLRYADQIPPFNIALTFVNEVGNAALMVIEDVILANEGGGYSIDDITSEVAFTYIARSISPLKAYVPAGTSSSNFSAPRVNAQIV